MGGARMQRTIRAASEARPMAFSSIPSTRPIPGRQMRLPLDTETATYRCPREAEGRSTRPARASEPSSDWCVILGGTLRAMGSAELWLAIDRGDVTPATLVWREGMEAWMPVGQMPDLALALTLSAPPLRPTAAPAMAEADAPSPVRPSEAGREALDTLVSGQRTSGWDRISTRMLPPPRRRFMLAQVCVAFGSAVAASAITAALLLSHEASGDPSRRDVTTSVCAPSAERAVGQGAQR